MNSRIRWALTVSAIAVLLPTRALGQDPISRAVSHEAVRLAAAAQPPAPADTAWRRVRNLPTGTRIIVVAASRLSTISELVTATETDVTLSDATSRIVRIDRRDILQIKSAPRKRNLAGCAAAGYGGFALGGIVGGLAGGAIGDAVSRKTDSGGMTGMGIGLLAGGTAGATWAFRACRYAGGDVIYALPRTT
jgi:hypothetical protein